jgi:Mce-associated membrane protein
MPRPLPRALRGASESGPSAVPTASRPSPRPRPRPHPGTPPEVAPEPVHDGPETSGRRFGLASVGRRTVTVLAALVVLLAMATSALGFQDYRAAKTATAADQALTAARTSAETLFSYDYRSIDADLAAARKVITGKLARDYSDTSAVVKPQATAVRAVVEATVSQAAVVSASPDQVVVLLYLNQSAQNKNLPAPRMDMSRVRLTMDSVDGNWRISRAEPL